MRSSRLRVVPFAALALACVAVFATPGQGADAVPPDDLDAALYAASENAARNNLEDLLRDPGTPVLGNGDGDVSIVEFFDYQCPYCKAAEPRLRALVESDGNIRHVIKDFPILGPASVVAAKAALASKAQGKYKAFHQALMDQRGQLTEDRVFVLAAAVGLDVDRLRADMVAPEVADQLIENFNLARKLKISVIPGFIVDDKVLSGVSVRTSSSAIDFDAEVAAARAAGM